MGEGESLGGGNGMLEGVNFHCEGFDIQPQIRTQFLNLTYGEC